MNVEIYASGELPIIIGEREPDTLQQDHYDRKDDKGDLYGGELKNG
jgi:hypothetical protein